MVALASAASATYFDMSTLREPPYIAMVAAAFTGGWGEGVRANIDNEGRRTGGERVAQQVHRREPVDVSREESSSCPVESFST